MAFFCRLFFYGVLVSGAGLFASRLIEFLDLYKVVHSNVPGPCKFVKGVEHGAEDIAVLPSGIAILSTGLQLAGSPTGGTPGALMTFDFSSPNSPAKVLKLSGFKGHLNPHGLSLYTEGDKTFLYVINHPPNMQAPPSDTVERFLLNLEKETLIHEKSFQDPEFTGLDDLVVVGKDKFYTTNMFTMQSKILRELESYLLFVLPLQNVVYFDGQKGTVVVNGRYGSNGVNVSPDKKYLYLSELSKKRISSFRIESPTNLVPVDTKSLGAIPDNIDVDPESGDLWIGLHARGLTVALKLLGFSTECSSQALRVGVKDGKFTGSAEIFADNGSILSGGSVAVPYKNAVLLGTLGQKALHCQLSGFNSALKL